MSHNLFSFVSRTLSKGNVLSFGICKVSSARWTYISRATITSIANRDPNYSRKPPFPYKEKDYGMVRSWFDRTSERFDDNTKIIIVDGPIAVGKSDFAKELAKHFDMLYMPEANMDMIYINPYGFDTRSLNPKLSPNLQQTDEKSFCLEPKQLNTSFFQFSMFEMRCSMYIDALAHLMNTGQGVVMVRSVYSDIVFAEAMAKMGYIRKQVLNAYHDMRNTIFPELLRPHLQIYLDIPVPLVQERIKARGKDWEINSKALTPAYLETMEDIYKRKLLPQVEEHAELLVYDWSEFGDMELVIEDIERLDFDKYTYYDKKMRDWLFSKEQVVSDFRMQYTNANHKYELIQMLDLPCFDCPELYMTGDDEELLNTTIYEAPGNKYTRGFNKSEGDTNILFRNKGLKARYPYYNQ